MKICQVNEDISLSDVYERIHIDCGGNEIK